MMTPNGHEVPDKVFVRIQKLLALSTSSNENEAALAAAKAQELLFAYELEMSDVEGMDVDDKPVVQDIITVNEGHRGVNWKMTVFTTVVRTSMCRDLVSYYTPYPNHTITKGYIIGRPADIAMAKYTFNFLVSELERLARDYVNRYTGTDHRTRVRNSWLMGAASGVASKLNAEFNARRGESKGSFALVVNKDAAISVWMKEHYPRLGGTYSSSTPDYYNSGAYEAGYETGKNLGTARALGDGSETKRLKG